MAKSHYDNKNIDIENTASETVRFDQQQLPTNDIDNNKMSSIPKPTKKQEHEKSFRKKLLKEHITSQLEDPDLIRPYTNLKEYPLSKIITSIETFEKEQKKNLKVIWDSVFKLIITYDYYAIDCNTLEKRLQEQNVFNTGLELEQKATKV